MDEFDFNIGAQVHCRDGKCGRLSKVVVNPDTLQVTDLIVEEGFLLKRARVFPISVVERTTEQDIYLSVHSDDLGSYREYREVEYERVASGSEAASFNTSQVMPYGGVTTSNYNVAIVREKVRQGLSSDDLALLAQGTPVKNQEGVIGKLDHVITNADSSEITHLVVRHGILFPERLDIPIALVERISENGILVAATNEELQQLPRYTPSDTDMPSAEAVAVEGLESLPEQAVTESVVDSATSLAEQIADVLLADPRTSACVIEVINERGIITLVGEANSRASREAATEITAAQPGVISVVNTLRVV